MYDVKKVSVHQCPVESIKVCAVVALDNVSYKMLSSEFRQDIRWFENLPAGWVAFTNRLNGEWFYAYSANARCITNVALPVHKMLRVKPLPMYGEVIEEILKLPTMNALITPTKLVENLNNDFAEGPVKRSEKIGKSNVAGTMSKIVTIENDYCSITFDPSESVRGGEIRGTDKVDTKNYPHFNTIRVSGYRKAKDEIEKSFTSSTRMKDVMRICSVHKMRPNYYCES